MMDIVKKNIVSIICGVVALAAVIVAFTMVSGRATELQTELNGRNSVFETLTKLLNGQRQMPVVDPDNPDPGKLTKFPSHKIIESGGAIVAEMEKESKDMMAAAVQMNQHLPLEPGSLPEPGMSPPAFNFRNRYQRFFPAPPASPLDSQLAKDLHAGMPPTPEEITARQAALAKDLRDKYLQLVNGQPSNEADVTAMISDQSRKLPDQMRKDIADKSLVYIDPTTFQPWMPVLQATGAPAPADIYAAQLTLWLQQDVVAGVNDANKGAKNVRDSTVKHLIHVFVTPTPVTVGTTPPGTDPDAALTKDNAISPTGRSSNGMYDVFHIQIEADVDAAKLPDFLRALGTGRFMTPLWADVSSVDNAVKLGQGYDYGSGPVLNVKVQCEVLYLRQWDRPLMPKVVREKLGLPPEEPPAAPAAPAASAQ